MSKLLLFGYGNPSRGDDALGVNLIDRITLLRFNYVECQSDMQLQIEHVTDLINCDPPSALLHVYQEVYGCAAPPSFLLRIRGYHFGLDTALSIKATVNLEVAVALTSRLCKIGNLEI